MIPCISEATSLSTPFDVLLEAWSRAGWTNVELWLTKIEVHLKTTSTQETRKRLSDLGLAVQAASYQGGLLTSLGEQRQSHWTHYQQRLEILQALEIPVLVLAPDFNAEPDQACLGRAIDSLAAAAQAAKPYGVRLALEFPKTGAFCTSLDTALALVTQAGEENLGVCLDLFHYYTGPSKFEDLAYLQPQNLALVQVSDLIGTPRELAKDSDRVLPGDGDFQLVPILDHLQNIGYTGAISLEVTNPAFWDVPADRVADVGRQALLRLLEQVKPSTSVEGA